MSNKIVSYTTYLVLLTIFSVGIYLGLRELMFVWEIAARIVVTLYDAVTPASGSIDAGSIAILSLIPNLIAQSVVLTLTFTFYRILRFRIQPLQPLRIFYVKSLNVLVVLALTSYFLFELVDTAPFLFLGSVGLSILNVYMFTQLFGPDKTELEYEQTEPSENDQDSELSPEARTQASGTLTQRKSQNDA